MTTPTVTVTEYTDPTCPFAFSAAPDLLALQWFWGEQLKWQRRLVVLAETREENAAKGITVEMVGASGERLGKLYEMPLTSAVPEHVLVPLPISLALKTVELLQPQLADRFLRELQVAWHSRREPIDEPKTAVDVAQRAGVDAKAMVEAMTSEETRSALDVDKRAARSPLPAAAGPLDHKLGGPPEERRYTCPSLEFARCDGEGQTLVAPGMQNLAVYETLLANVAPELVRRAPAGSVQEALEFADWPLAAVEVARLMGVTTAEAAEALAASSASEQDGYWSL